MASNFEVWFRKNLREYARDIAEYGADGGFPHITYYTDTDKIYRRHEEDIYEMLREDAESFGYENVDAFTASFRRSDMLDDPQQRRCLLVWYACERCAGEMAG